MTQLGESWEGEYFLSHLNSQGTQGHLTSSPRC